MLGVLDDDHENADASSGKVYINAANSCDTLVVPARSRIDIGGHSNFAAERKRFESFKGHVHHWKLVERWAAATPE